MAQLEQSYGVKQSFYLALIRRIPGLRLADKHTLQMCAGPNCGKHTQLAEEAEKLCKLKGIELKYMGCQRMCGKGPNIRFDGKLYHKATEELLKELLK